MKKLVLLSIALFSAQAINCASNREYLDKYLPADSLILQKCKQEKSRIVFGSQASKGCDYINDILRRLDQEDVPTYNGGWLGDLGIQLKLEENNRKMRDAIRPILLDETDATKFAELDKVARAADLARKEHKERPQRLMKEAEERRRAEKANPKF